MPDPSRETLSRGAFSSIALRASGCARGAFAGSSPLRSKTGTESPCSSRIHAETCVLIERPVTSPSRSRIDHIVETRRAEDPRYAAVLAARGRCTLADARGLAHDELAARLGALGGPADRQGFAELTRGKDSAEACARELLDASLATRSSRGSATPSSTAGPAERGRSQPSAGTYESAYFTAR